MIPRGGTKIFNLGDKWRTKETVKGGGNFAGDTTSSGEGEISEWGPRACLRAPGGVQGKPLWGPEEKSQAALNV